MRNNLEIDLFKTDWIVSKCLNSDVYSQNLYAAICNNLFYKDGEEWGASWRMAGGIVADLRNKGERYIDWYCSGMVDKQGYLPEGTVSDEIRKDLGELAWTIKPYD